MHKNIPVRIQEKITIDVEKGCWIFKGNDPSSNGYQRCWLYGSRWQVHRLVYELITGKDIRELQLDHLCEVRACCNPAHMDPVTSQVNCKRKFRRRKLPGVFEHED